MSNLEKNYVVTMEDGSKWSIPVIAIALDRAKYYAKEFDGDLAKSLILDTIPLFEDRNEIADWAKNNMDWSDVKDVASRIEEPSIDSYDEMWPDCEWRVE